MTRTQVVLSSLGCLLLLAICAGGCSDRVTVESKHPDGVGDGGMEVGTSPAMATPGERLTLDDIFENVIPEIFDRTWEDFEVRGNAPIVFDSYTFFHYTIRGPKMWAYCNRNLVDPCECDCALGLDPCLDPDSQTILREARFTIRLWVPNDVDFAVAPFIVIDKVDADGGEGEPEKVAISKLLARKGIITVLWEEEDEFPVGAQPTSTIAAQFGFGGPAAFQHSCKHWLRTRDPLNLTAEDLRMDDRYHNAQSFVLCGTFFRRLIDNYHAGDPQAVAWADSVQILYAGGSKTAGGAYTAAGIDSRCIALRTSGFLEFETGERAASHRFENDWRECPVTCPEDDTCTDLPPDSHRWYRYTNWLRLNKDNLPSYWDTYRLGRNRERYHHLLFLEIVGTHDWINPLGSADAFWASVDGLVDGVPDASEERFNFRLSRRINGDHGTSYTVGRTSGGRDVRSDELLLVRAMLHLAKGKALPRMEAAGMDVSGDPATEPWMVRVRVTDLPPEHDPLVEEQYKIHIAFSDDRDFRRCTPPIVCHEGDKIPCAKNGVCRDPAWDDNREEEDKFIRTARPTVVVDGEFRDLYFPAPAEALAFATPPMIAAIVEVRIDDTIPFNIKDDWVIHTEVMYANEELYPPYWCCGQ